MGKIASIAIIFIFLVLNLLALDDITTGNEPNYYLEWGFVAFSLTLLTIYMVRKPQSA